MADDEKELKDQRVVTMMSPSELEAIDDWMFKNRIRSRGEAIRRLCHLGVRLDEHRGELLRVVMAELSRVPAPSSPNTHERDKQMAIHLSEFMMEVYAMLGRLVVDDVNARLNPDIHDVIVGADEIREAFKKFESTEDKIEAFKRFSKAWVEASKSKEG